MLLLLPFRQQFLFPYAGDQSVISTGADGLIVCAAERPLYFGPGLHAMYTQERTAEPLTSRPRHCNQPCYLTVNVNFAELMMFVLTESIPVSVRL